MNTKYFSNFANNTDSGFYVYVFVIQLYKGKKEFPKWQLKYL